MPDSVPGTLFPLITLILLTLMNAFFSMSEIAIITINDTKIKRMAAGGHKAAAKIVQLTRDSSRFLATIQVGVTFAGFLSSAVAAGSFAGPLGDLIASGGWISISLASTLSMVLITFLLAFFSLVFGELVPKKLAIQKAEDIAFRLVSMLIFFGMIFKPFVWLLSKTANVFVRMAGIDPEAARRTVTEEEILMMVDVGEEHGAIEQSEREMIANIFEFDDTTASEIMTHRTEIVAVENTDNLSEIVRIAMEDAFSRMPVFEDDLDTILGIVYVKDLLRFIGGKVSDKVKATDLMRPAYFIPEGKKLSSLFAEMTEKKVQMAIVVDEYGGTSGLVTMEDLIESILGNIQDEYDDEDDEISQVSENCFTVDGTTAIDEVEDLIGAKLPHGDYDTIAGYILSRIENIPKPGEHPTIAAGNASLTVELVEEQRISKVLVVVDRAEIS